MGVLHRVALVGGVSLQALGAPAAAPLATVGLPDLSDGRYWVRRVVRDEASGSEGYGADGQVGERWVRQRTACQPLVLATDGPRRQVRLGDVTFELAGRTGGKMLVAPVRSSVRPPLELPGECHQPLGDLATPVIGSIYVDEASCRAVPATVTRRCQGDVCHHDGEAPFTLPTCEAALRQLEHDAAPVLTASHAELARSFARVQALTRRGGRLWTYEVDEGRCYPLVVTPRPDDQVALREAFTTLDGARVTYTAVVALEPLFHVARYASESGWTEDADHSGSGGGHSFGPFTTGLYLGREVVLVGTEWLYFSRAACAAHTSAP